MLALLLVINCKPHDNNKLVDGNRISNDSIAKSDLVAGLGQEEEKGKCDPALDNKVFEYLYDSEIPDHVFTLIFKCEDSELKGKLFGPAPEGEHGLWFFRADLDNLRVDSLKNIEFEFSQGYLYPDRITMDNYLDSLSTENAGISRGQMYYKGKLSGDSIVFQCRPEYDCYDEIMTFRLKS